MSSPDRQPLHYRNDNLISSWLNRGDWVENQKFAPYTPLASQLIASRHCKTWWKNHPESWDYQYAHHALCVQLYYPCTTRENTLRIVAIFLECNPLALTSDQDIQLTRFNQ